jgi:hypothetical protein
VIDDGNDIIKGLQDKLEKIENEKDFLEKSS